MYSYTYDEKTGGILINSTPTIFSKEPRPVYASELDLLGFGQFWKYDSKSNCPYMWAESNKYWYRGKNVAKLKGGNLYQAPEIIIPLDENGNQIMPEIDGKPLKPINISAMIDANKSMLEIIEETTVKKIVSIYEKYCNKLDIFHVAFSGGKDSAVLLDLVRKSLPKKSFVVVFGDTGMEFPDTYDAVKLTKASCEKDDIPFYTSHSDFEPCESWKLFGPPARVLRWCCNVHKSTPQTLKLREITGKKDYRGLDFVGVRKHESVARSSYDYENYGKKQKGQFSFNAILDWTSAEIWLYIYANNLIINEAYKKGNSRAGCLFCPMSGGLSDYTRRMNYTNEIDKYIDYIKSSYIGNKPKEIDSYLTNGGWNARKNGRELKGNESKCEESTEDGFLIIKVSKPSSEWKEWIKTIGILYIENEGYLLDFEGAIFPFSVTTVGEGYIVKVPDSAIKINPAFGKYMRQVFRKASYCVGCKVCETNCQRGCISFHDGRVLIENCVHCRQCHDIDSGCLLFHSIRLPQGGGKGMKSLNSFADHAPKSEWLHAFFDLKEEFFTCHTLGPMMYDMFRRFLRDAGLNDKNHFTSFAQLLFNIGWESSTSMGLILVNLVADNPQMEWYVKNFDIGVFYEHSIVENMLIAQEVSQKDSKSIIKAYRRITETPIGTVLCFGYMTEDKKLVRTHCSISDNKVVLYGLFKFAEKCNNFKEFTLAWLMNDSIDRDGISPTRIFGLDYEEAKSILMGLSSRYSEFIDATFTNNLDKITLMDKTSQDVLELFKEED